MPPPPDYYLILGAKPDASDEQIKRAYRKKALAYHPDRGGAVRDMQLLNEAWAVLGEPEKRREYDVERVANGRRVVERKAAKSEEVREEVTGDTREDSLIAEIGWVAQRISFYLGKLIGAFTREPKRSRKRGAR